MILLSFVFGELGRREQRAKEEPASELSADKVRMLSLPSQASRLAERFFHNRRGVHEHFDFATRQPINEPASQALKALLYDFVVVAVLGVDGDGCAVLSNERLQRVRIRSI